MKRLMLGIMIAGLTSMILLVATPSSAKAATAEQCAKSSSSLLGLPTWYKYLEPRFEDGECKLKEFEFKTDIGLVLAAVFEMLLRVAMYISIGFVVFGGVQYITSQGEPDRLTGARSTIVNALIGLVIAIIAASVVSFVAGRFIQS